MHLASCPACGRAVSVLRDGDLCTHGPGPHDEFICPGSGNQDLVQAAQHLRVQPIPLAPQCPERLSRSALRPKREV
jgi:hypothetical protein